MTFRDLRRLGAPDVDAWLRELETDAADLLHLQNRLRSRLPGETARAASELLWLRTKARKKFPSGTIRWFDREGYEQATGEWIAEYRARRFSGGGRVCDACLGIGGDAVALAQRGRVIGIEVSPLRCALALCNAQSAGAASLAVVCGDATRWLPPHDLLFLDPSRRRGHQRFVTVQELTPQWGFCVEAASAAQGAAVKLSPLMHPEDYGLDAEIEFFSAAGECRDQTLWFGALKQGRLRATVLPAGESISVDDPAAEEVSPVLSWVYIPDPAVARAGLSAQCAARFGLRLVSRDLEVVTGDRRVNTCLLRPYRVKQVIPWNRKLLRQEFRRLRARPDILIRRGTRASEDSLRALFPKYGDRPVAALFLAAPEHPVAVVAERHEKKGDRELGSSGHP